MNAIIEGPKANQALTKPIQYKLVVQHLNARQASEDLAGTPAAL